MSGLRVSNEVILLKTEVTYNTDPTPVAATNALLVSELGFSLPNMRMNDRAAIRGSIGQLQKVYGGNLAELTFKVEVKGSGAAGTAPELGPALLSCGMDETIVGATSVTYQPHSGTSAAHASCTIYYYEGGRKLHILTGCRGDVSFAVEAGGIMWATFKFLGHFTQPTDASQPSPTYNSQVPKAALGMAISLNGVTAIVARSFNFALNNVLEAGGSIAATDGYGPVIITKRDVTGEVVIESELDSVLDLESLMVAGTRFAFASGTLGSTAGNRVVLSTPSSSTYITDFGLETSNGIRGRRVPLAVDDSTSDQEISLIFT
jgi:hypothetical protein